MRISGLLRFSLAVLMAVWIAQATSIRAQERGGTDQTDKVQPVNRGPNPYRVIQNWARDPEGRPWGGSNGVAIDVDGKSVWATDRCSPGPVPGCLGTKANPVHKYDESGKEIRSFGKMGTGPGEFRTRHALVFDSQGRLIVADRHNHRIQMLTKEGKFLREYDNFGRVSGLAIDKNDFIYTSDSESTEKVHPGWLRGIRIGSLKDGKVSTFIPAHNADTPDGAMGEGIAIDAAGNLYTAEAQLRGVTKYVK